MKMNKVEIKFLIILMLFSFNSWSETEIDFYKKVFPTLEKTKKQKIADPISEKPTNTEVLLAYNKNDQLLGYIREVNTTTGCNSACLPVIFTLFYDKEVNFKKLLSRDGLTKKNHAPFTPEDYQKLELILLMNPKEFKKVGHPTEMVDAISGATLKDYEQVVVKEAAYSSLRVNTYNQQTMNEIKKLP